MDDSNWFITGTTFGIAIIGVVLGLINTWRAIDQDRVKIIVRPKQSLLLGDIQYSSRYRNLDQDTTTLPLLTIEVINKSQFEITVEQVGVTYWWTKARGLAIGEIRNDNLPCILKPRTSKNFILDQASTAELLTKKRARSVFVSTSCGEHCFGKSRAFQQLKKIYKKRHAKK